VFACFLVLVGFRLSRGRDDEVRSHLVGKPVPEFALKPAVPGRPGLGTADLKTGGPRLVNVFGSWCIPCAVESPQLLELERRGVPIDAIAVRDRPEDVARFLVRYGDPFQRIGDDPRSAVQLALGSSGVPETFVVDGKGVIRYQHIGVVHADAVPKIFAAWQAAR
jgi:cytochrome c biogenesis protein CcmG/thiol:disulfide interchange protein DsbE